MFIGEGKLIKYKIETQKRIDYVVGDLVFKNEKDAKKHVAKMELQDLFEEIYYYGMSSENLATILVEYENAIREIFDKLK